MGRRPNPQRRVELLDKIVEYITEHGLATLSLRPLANALGTSTYTLTYQFGTKTELIHAVVDHLEEQQREMLSRPTAGGTAERMAEIWSLMSSQEGLNRARLLAEMVTMAAREPETFEGREPRMVTDRLESLAARLVTSGVPEERSEAVATLIQAVLTGMSMDVLATGDVERTGAAMALVVEAFGHGPFVEQPEADGQTIDVRDAVTLPQPIDAA